MTAENLPPELRDAFTRLVEQMDTLIESLSRGGGYVDEDLELIAGVRDAASRFILVPPLARPPITSPSEPPRELALAHLRYTIDQVALACADALVPLRAARDEYPGAAWTDEIPPLEHAIERFMKSKGN